MEYDRTRGLPEYDAWLNMKRRCYDKNDKRFPLYGARGITVCSRWLGKNGFKNFLSDMGKRPHCHSRRQWSLDRIDVNKGYSPDNCRWATAKEQSRNKTNNLVVFLWGERYCVKEACEMLKVNSHNFYQYNATHKKNNVEDNFADYLILLNRKERLYV